MIAIDTNVLVRLAVRDDLAQANIAADLIRSNEVLVCSTVLLEVEWILRSLYGLSREAILTTLKGLADISTVRLEAPDTVEKAFTLFEAGLDFADALHLASARGCEAFATFDRKFARRASTGLPVRLL